eukprot:COSAG02_NODE_274_length_26244_cov_36.943507_32_plen_168_part_00
MGVHPANSPSQPARNSSGILQEVRGKLCHSHSVRCKGPFRKGQGCAPRDRLHGGARGPRAGPRAGPWAGPWAGPRAGPWAGPQGCGGGDLGVRVGGARGRRFASAAPIAPLSLAVRSAAGTAAALASDAFASTGDGGWLRVPHSMLSPPSFEQYPSGDSRSAHTSHR